MYSKVLVDDGIASVMVSEDAGVLKLVAQANVAPGGGSIAGALKASAQLSIEMHPQVFADAGLDILAAKYAGSAVGLAVEALKKMIDAELAK